MKYTLLIITLLSAFDLFSINGRENMIPNGTKNACLNCHFSSLGGDVNQFGKQVKEKGLKNNNVIWANLFNLDADGDGFTNGQELQETTGTWKMGDPQPGTRALVTNPGNSSSIPTSVRSIDYFSDLKASPNPFVNQLSIEFFAKQIGNIDIQVFNLNGNLVFNTNLFNFSPSNKSILWNGTDLNGNKLAAGTYFLRIFQNNEFSSITVVLN